MQPGHGDHAHHRYQLGKPHGGGIDAGLLHAFVHVGFELFEVLLELLGEVLRRAGGTPVNLPGGELFTALKTGAIDATEWVGPLHGLRFGFYQAAKYYYYPGWHEPGTYLEYFFNKKAYESLPADLQKIVDAACVENEHWVLAQFDARNGAALQTLINKHKVPVVRFPDAVLDALKPLAEAVREEEAAKTPIATKVNASFKKFQKEVGTWGSISEKAYYNGIMPKFSLKG